MEIGWAIAPYLQKRKLNNLIQIKEKFNLELDFFVLESSQNVYLCLKYTIMQHIIDRFISYATIPTQQQPQVLKNNGIWPINLSKN